MRFISTAAVGTVAALTVLAGAAPAPAAIDTEKKPPKVASVHGSGRLSYVYSPDDDIRFTVDAESAPFTRPIPGLDAGLPTDARGTVKIFHHVPAQHFTAWSEATVDCLVTGGGTAVLTAIVTESNIHNEGKRFGLSIQQGRKGESDRLGFAWDIVNFEPREADDEGNALELPTGTCMATAPFAPVVKGGFKVMHTDLPALPPDFPNALPKTAAKTAPEARRG